MQAVRFHEYGPPADVLSIDDVPVPQPGHGEVLIRMQASPVNPSDVMFIEGRYGQEAEFPATPGFEGVGMVEASGGGILGKLLTGKRVAAMNRQGGNWAEYTVIPAKQAIPLAGDIPLDQAATFFVNPATAVVMTRKVLAVPKGEWLLQSAAASSLGQMIIRLAKHSGFRTLNLVRRESQIAELKELGAHEVLKFDAATDDPDELVERIRRITGGGVQYAIDPVAGLVGSTIIRCLSAKGKLLSFGTLTDVPLTIPPRFLIGPQASIEGFWLGKWMDEQSLFKKIQLIRQVTDLIRKKVLTSTITSRIRLTDVLEAFATDQQGKAMILIERE